MPEATALDEASWSELEALVTDSIRRRPAALQRRIRLFLRLIQWLPLARYGRRFTNLDAAQGTEFLAGMQDHRVALIRIGFWGLRTLALLGYYGRPAAAEAIGYRPHPLGWQAE